jgi:uncharacterized alpha/beta hydrolase family protein
MRWISVKDSLPPIEKSVLIYGKYNIRGNKDFFIAIAEEPRD